MKHSKKKFVPVSIDKISNNVAIIYKRYFAEVILNEINVTGHGNNNHCNANKSCDEIIDGNAEYSKRLGFKIIEK